MLCKTERIYKLKNVPAQKLLDTGTHVIVGIFCINELSAVWVEQPKYPWKVDLSDKHW